MLFPGNTYIYENQGGLQSNIKKLCLQVKHFDPTFLCTPNFVFYYDYQVFNKRQAIGGEINLPFFKENI